MIAEVQKADLDTMRASRSLPAYRRHSPIIVGVALSLLIHAFAIFSVIRQAPLVVQPPPSGSDRNLTISLVPATKARLQPQPESLSAPDEVADRKAAPVKKKPPRRAAVPQRQTAVPPDRVPPLMAEAEPKARVPLPANDMMSMLDAARKRRAAAQAQESEQAPSQDEELRRRDNAVLANIATSIGRPNGSEQKARGGVFQVRRVGVSSAEFLFMGWSTNLRRNSTQLVSVSQNAEPDIETAVVKKMIDIIRAEKHDDFIWDSYRLGRQVTLSARPEFDARLRQFLMQEFFPEHVPVRLQ